MICLNIQMNVQICKKILRNFHFEGWVINFMSKYDDCQMPWLYQ